MKFVEIPIAGPTYNNRCSSLSTQLLQNMYPENNHDRISVYQFPGVGSAWASTNTSGCRGMKYLNGVLYKVSGDKLYSIDSLRASTEIGTILGSGPVHMDHDGNILVITTGTKSYQYNGTSLSENTAFASAASVTILNQQAIYDGDGATIDIANASTPGTLNGVITAEVKPDNIQCVQAFNQILLGFGDLSIEPWWNSNSAGIGFDRYQNTLIKPGVASPYALAQTDDLLYFLGSDMLPYRLSGLTKQYIGNPAIAYEWSGYSPTNSRVMVLKLDGQNMIYYSFPTSNKSYMYNEASNTWATMAGGNAGESIHPMFDYAYAYNKHLVSDRNNGNVYELDWDTYTYNTDIIQWRRVTMDIDGSMFGMTKRDKLSMGELSIDCTVGRGATTGQGSAPVLVLEYSDNYGETWSKQKYVSTGSLGKYTFESKLGKCPNFYKRRFRITFTDPCNFTLMGMYASIGKA